MWQAANESTAARYVRTAPPGERKDVLSAVCMNRIAQLPVATAEEFGEPITDIYGLEPAAEVVREVLRQDRSMYAWVARTCVIFLDTALEMGAGGWSDSLENAMKSVGFERGNQLRPDLVDGLPGHVRQRVFGLHATAMGVFWAVAQPHIEQDRDKTIYRRIFESTDRRTELTAHDVAAWACVIVARLCHRGMTTRPLFYSDGYSSVPLMREPGWYPNPYNRGELVGGEPAVQRFWDGTDWSDHIRFWNGRVWVEGQHSMREMPGN